MVYSYLSHCKNNNIDSVENWCYVNNIPVIQILRLKLGILTVLQDDIRKIKPFKNQ